MKTREMFTDEELVILNKLLFKARESTAQMIDTCENLLHKNTVAKKDEVRSTQKRLGIDLENIKSIEQKIFGSER